MIIFLYGADTFRSRDQMKKMVEKFKKDRDPQGYNTVILNAKLVQPGEILGEISATPFLAEKRMLVIENLLNSKKKDLIKEILKKIEEKSLPESNVILFWDEGGEFKDKDAKLLFDRLLQEKYAQMFEELKGVKLSAWIDGEVKDREGKIDRPAIQYLVDNIGGDIWKLNSLIDQLIAYSVGMITLADTKVFLPEKINDNIFNLVDAIVAKQPKNVFKMIQEQYRKGEDAQFIFAMLLRQFRILLELRDLFERKDNLPSDIIAKQLGLHPFVVKKSLPLVKRYSLDQLKNIYHQLLEIDIKTKTGRGDQSVLLDVFVGKVCN